MSERRLDRETSKHLRAIADRLLQDLLSDPAVAKVVADPFIEDAVAAGELIPRERLMLANGFELAPMGRLEELETAILDACEALEGDKPSVSKALAALEKAVPPEPAPGPETGDMPAKPDPCVDDATDADASNDPDPEPTPGPEPGGMNSPEYDTLTVPVVAVEEEEAEPEVPRAPALDKPTEDDPGWCEVCEKDLSYRESLLSWTRFRIRLCGEHFFKHQPAPGPDAGDSSPVRSEEEDAEEEDQEEGEASAPEVGADDTV